MQRCAVKLTATDQVRSLVMMRRCNKRPRYTTDCAYGKSVTGVQATSEYRICVERIAADARHHQKPSGAARSGFLILGNGPPIPEVSPDYPVSGGNLGSWQAISRRSQIGLGSREAVIDPRLPLR
jgi:hypothetical protein